MVVVVGLPVDPLVEATRIDDQLFDTGIAELADVADSSTISGRDEEGKSFLCQAAPAPAVVIGRLCPLNRHRCVDSVFEMNRRGRRGRGELAAEV
jgi:hypothetical protein